MSVNAFVMQIAILFLPGIIWAGLDSRYSSKRESTNFSLILNAFVFGVVSYSVVYLFYTFCGDQFNILDVVDQKNGDVHLSQDIVDELLWSVGASLVLAIVWIYSENYKIVSKFLQMIKATRTYGEEDVWDFVLNSNSPMSEYLNYRDFENQIIYSGYVEAFSETGKVRELLLREVCVYDFDGNFLYDMPHVYLGRKQENLHVEFPYVPVVATIVEVPKNVSG